MKPASIRGILFDFDGVLANTAKDNFKAWSLALKDFKADLKESDYYPLEGTALPEIAKNFCRKYGIDHALHGKIVKKKEEYYLKLHHFELYPGVGELIVKLKSKKIRIGLATAALKERLEKSVPGSFLEKFDCIISGDKTARGKPFPDPYLKCLSELNLPSHACIAVENAPLGIKSAKGANLYCIAICSTLDRSYLTEADEIIGEFRELHKILL